MNKDKKEIRIEDYFRNDLGKTRTSFEQNEVNRIRREIDSFYDEADCAKYIYKRRNYGNWKQNRLDDEEWFGIPQDAEINEHYPSKPNKYYRKLDDEDIPDLDYYSNNNYFDKINFLLNNKITRSALWIFKHWKSLLITIAISLILFFLIFAIIYAIGIMDSMGHTPFAMCDNNSSSSPSFISQEDIDVSANLETSCQSFIIAAEAKGWKREAIIGTLSYILQEGGKSGTFSYESHWVMKGPAGVTDDRTLNNEAWLKWLDNEGSEQMRTCKWSYYYGKPKWAIGLGLCQSTDTFQKNGPKKSSNATALIKAAIADGVPWQDPNWQCNYYLEHIFNNPSAFDGDGSDPTKSNYSAEEWCRRVTAGVGMPAWRWNDSKYETEFKKHTAHLVKAEYFFNKYTGGDITATYSSNYSVIENPCVSNGFLTGGNSSIADAAVSLASGTRKILWDCDGYNSPRLHYKVLDTYREVKTDIFPGDPHYASCDRSTATAVRWAGADDTFPAGDTSVIYSYLCNSSKWTYIGDYGKCEVQPGDVLITKGKGHVKIYVGNEAVKKRFPDSDADMYAGSFHDYFPRVYKDDPSYDTRIYAVFRCTTPDNSKTYEKAGTDRWEKKK